MRLGFDVDGIVADMAQAMIDKVNENYGLSLTIDVFKNHEIRDNSYVDDPKLNKDIIDTMLYGIIRNNTAVQTLAPYDDSIRYLNILKKNGHELFFITARSPEQNKATISWFRANKIPFDEVHVVGRHGKGSYGRMLNLDFFVDDDMSNLEDMYRYKNRWFKGLALFTRPWNSWMHINAQRYVRLNDWPELVRHLGIHHR